MQIRENFDRIQALSAEKLHIARKVYAYCEINVQKVDQKMKLIEADIVQVQNNTTNKGSSSGKN